MERVVDPGFGTTGRTHQHDSEANREGLPQLDYLVHKGAFGLLLFLHDLVLDGRLEYAVVDVRHIDARKQVIYDGLEDFEVVCQELGHIRVSHGTDEDHILCQGGFCALEITRHD